MAKYPRIIEQFSVQVEGFGITKTIDEIKLPDFNEEVYEHDSPNGITTYKIKTGRYESMECEITTIEPPLLLFKKWGINHNTDPLEILVTGSGRADGSNPFPMSIKMKGDVIKKSFGSWKGKDMKKFTFTIDCKFVDLRIDGQEVFYYNDDLGVVRENGMDMTSIIARAILEL